MRITQALFFLAAAALAALGTQLGSTNLEQRMAAVES